MDADDKPVVIYSTWPSLEAAEAAARSLVAKRLAACANILPGMIAIYEWNGEIARDGEVAMILKTRAALADSAIAAARDAHPYDTPAFLVVPVTGGSAPFLAWITAQTRVATTEE